jgi:PAS domain S-box-containing protein
MRAALAQQAWDVVICDHRLPQFDTPSALALLQGTGLDIPFIIVSGTIDEEIAVAMMKAGAQDYLKKDNLARLAPAVARELRDAQARRERRQAETQKAAAINALRESEARYRAVAESAHDAIITADRKGNIVDWNGGARQMFGYDATEIIGQSLTRLMPARYRTVHETGMARLAAGGEPRIIGKVIEMHGLRKDGSEFPFELSLATWETAQGMFFTAILRDITERKVEAERLDRLVAELARSNAELERFAYVASHDLQEPLRMVASFVQLLGDRYRGQLDADADDFIGFAVEGAHRMQQLLLDLLAYSRANRVSRPLGPTDSGQALALALRYLALDIADSDGVVTHEALPAVWADSAQLTQLFENLIGNALKFRSAAPPQVHISARETFDASQAAQVWEFAVRDNGIGIEPEYHTRIFEAFRRLQARARYAGNGIGLAICQKIVERHGGRIWVESQLGQGSTFYFTIPA